MSDEVQRPASGPNRNRNVIDESLKVLIRHVYPAFFRLAGLDVPLSAVHISDTAINIREHRADSVFVIGDDDDPDHWALYVEFQMEPDPRRLRDWFYKTGALGKQLDREVTLLVIYVTCGGWATFPSDYVVARAGLVTGFRFDILRLWEHADAIRRGDYPELAPLLVLWENNPTEETLRRERELIYRSDVPSPIRADLLAVATAVALRVCAREVVATVFREDKELLKEASFVHESFEEEIAESRAEGRAEGELGATRQFLLRLLRQQFGELPAPVVERVESAAREWCEEVGERLLRARSLEDLGFSDDAATPP